MDEPIVGIVGGMGPESTIDLMRKIFAATPAAREQDHVHLLVDSNPKVPDRTAAILGRGESPVPALRESIRRLADAGAGLIVIACNAAHDFFEEIRTAAPVPVLNMIELCAREAAERCAEGEAVGLLATTGTVQSGIYDAALRRYRLRALVPSPEEQDELMRLVYGPGGIKAGRVEENAPGVAELGRKLIDRGARAVIAGCTEVELALAACEYPVVAPLRVLAGEVVRRVKGSTKEE